MTDNGHIVHVANPLEFLDSPEWASGEANCPANYDVSKFFLALLSDIGFKIVPCSHLKGEECFGYSVSLIF